MKTYHFNFSRWNDEEKCQEIQFPGEFYLASDVDRLRTEGRERVARELQRYDHGLSDPLEDYLPEADRILSALFDEVIHDSK